MFYKNVGSGNNGVIHYVFTVLLTIFGYVLGQIPLMIAMWYAINKHDDIGANVIDDFGDNPDFSLLHMDKNFGLFLMLLIFVFAITTLFLSVKYIHKRKILSLFTFKNKLDWKRIVWGTIVWFFLLAIIEFILYSVNPGNYTFREPDSSFVFLILISLAILPIQTTFEEVFTRGYILQSVTYNSKNVFFGFIVSVIVFMLLHGMNPETDEYGFLPMMSYYFSAAVLLGLIVVYDRRLEIAIGVHTATNIFGALIVTYKGAALQTDSLFITSKINPIILAFEFTILGIIFLVISAKVYKWDVIESFKYKVND